MLMEIKAYLLLKFRLFSLILIYSKEKKYNNNLGTPALIMYFYCMFIDMINGCIYVFLLVLTML